MRHRVAGRQTSHRLALYRNLVTDLLRHERITTTEAKAKEIPRMANRPGGYLRITGTEPRKGDGARMAVIELVDYVDVPPTPRPHRVTAAPSSAASPLGAAPAAEPVSAVEAPAETTPSAAAS